MKVAFVYDRVNKWGGAERVLLSLQKLFPNAHLYTSVYAPNKASWASVFNVRASFLQKFPFARTAHEYYALLMPLAFESFTFDEYDLVISITSEAAKGIITKPQTKHICYCLTPTRYLWSGYDDYFSNPAVRLLAAPVISYLRSWDLIAAQRPDAYIAISKEVQKRIKKYYDKDAQVVYPPIAFSRGPVMSFLPISARSSLVNSNDLRADRTPSTHATPFTSNEPKDQILNAGYFLIVSRLVPYKRIDLAINACNRLQLPLVIVGTGSEEKHLRSIAGPTINFVGNLTDEELVGYYRGCTALVFPGKEDLGLVTVEAQFFGKPVLAFKGGGSIETIIEGKTGEFFYPQSVSALTEKLQSFQADRFNPSSCRVQAEKFLFGNFQKQFMRIVEEQMSNI